MRPLLLRFQAFGAYPGLHEVDFEVLGRRGLFLVTGPTGTGKTTVFDAMVFALFGCLPGARSDGGDARSHHVGPDVESFVEFEFEADGVRYRVHRTPTWFKPPRKQGGNPSRQDGTATLARLVNGGSEPVAAQITNVTKACEHIVGLNAAQFQRVVLLPQGEFTKFLVAKESDRQELLRHLFGGQLYEAATTLLKARAAKLETAVGDVDTKIEHHRSNAVTSLRAALGIWAPDRFVADDAGLDDLQPHLDHLGPIKAEREGHLARRRTEAEEASQVATLAQQSADRFDEALALDHQLETLRADAAEIAALASAVDASRRGAVVVEAARLVAAAETAQRTADSAHEKVLHDIRAGFESMLEPLPDLTPAAVSAALAALAAANASARQLVTAAASAAANASAAEAATATAQRTAEEAELALAAAKAESQSLADQIELHRPAAEGRAGLEERKSGLSVAVQQRSELHAAASELPALADAAQRARGHAYAVMAAFIDTQAPRLAAELVDGEACSVCGSTSHPRKATHTSGDLVDHDQVEAARRAEAAASQQLDHTEARIATLAQALGLRAEQPLEALQAELAALEAQIAAARTSAAEIERLTPLHRAAVASGSAAEDLARTARDESITLAATAAAQRAEADRLATEAAVVDVHRLAVVDDALARLDGAGERLGLASNDVTGALTVLAERQKAAADALRASGFSTEAEAAAAVLEPDDERSQAERVEAWQVATQTAEIRRDQLAEQGVPEVRPDADVLEQKAGALRAEAVDLADQFTTASLELDRATTELASAKSEGAGSQALREERDDARHAFRTCNGEAGMRVKLERWVLASELERVTEAANVHLGRMSIGRYRLARKGDKGALVLEVFDAHTGKARATASLSGGEQFQASLSLALGLADVVGHGGTASGKQFEALFVDEGFGSLDPKALDQAIEALLMIQQGGRMVGAITHVEAMKERLHTGIEVSPNDDGKGSTLTVNP
jgi:exonuclease SbcC